MTESASPRSAPIAFPQEDISAKVIKFIVQFTKIKHRFSNIVVGRLISTDRNCVVTALT